MAYDDTVYPGGSATFDEGSGSYRPVTSGVPGFLEQAGQFLTGSNNPMQNMAVLPFLGTAAQQWNSAEKYRQLGHEAADRADPFGQYRRGYGDQLQGLYQDPSKIADTPGYKFTMDQTLNNTASKLASMGLLGSSQMQNTLADRAAGLASTTWNTEADRLAKLAGYQFDPANAGRFMMEGGKLEQQAQSDALASAMLPFIGDASGNGMQRGGGGPGGSGGPMNPANVGQAAQAIMQGGAAGMKVAGDLLAKGIRFINLPDGSVADLQAFQNVGGDNGDGSQYGYYPTDRAAGYMDDPNSQFYQGPAIPDYTNDMYPPIEDTGFNPDDYGYVPGGSNGDWDFNPITDDSFNFDEAYYADDLWG